MRGAWNWRSFFAAKGGNVAMVFAAAMLPIALAVGGAIDFSQALNARARLAAALDAAALAVAGSPNLSDGAARELAENFLTSNYTEAHIGRVQNIQLAINHQTGTVTIGAETAVRTTLLHLAGVHEIVVGWETEARRARHGIELSMVLDTSGSMAGTPIQALRDSVAVLIGILFETADDLDKLHIGMVPFSTAVNVGTQFERAWWLDPNAQNPIHSEEFSPGANRWTMFDALPDHDWGGCVEARRIPYDIDDTPPDPAQPDTLFVPYFAPDEPDASVSCNSWGQCTTTRRFPNSYVFDQLSGDTSSQLLTRLRYSPKYAAAQTDPISDYWAAFPSGPNWLCVSPPVTPLTNSRTALDQAANGLYAHGGTNIPLAIGWGLRLLSPMEPFPSPVPYNDRETFKAMIIMTDGDNQMLGGSSFGGTLGTSITNVNRSLYSAYGYSRTGRVGSTSSNTGALRTALDDRTRAACQVARDRGIRVYTVVFGNAVDATTRDMMRDCASHPSLYFFSPTPAELAAAFEVIADDLASLRLSR
ncbi:MAG: VWA domain-containing protein [Maricaulaceae bacterium]|nr:VWA domain-containing protein [Maricaulaceae bacterium]